VSSTISKVIKLAKRRQRSLGLAFVCQFWGLKARGKNGGKLLGFGKKGERLKG